MKIKNLFLPFDVFSRHKTAASFVSEKDGRVLDVGGGVNGLNRFIKNQIVVANLNAGDVIADGRNLPFDNNQFDVVTSIDVLEHIPKEDRQKFIDELLRVARKKVILSAPLGSDAHSRAEKRMFAYMKKKNQDSDYLKEHIKNGLPTKKELSKYFPKSKANKISFFFLGDFRLNNFLFKMQIKQFRNSLVNRVFFYWQKLANFFLNIFYFPFIKSKKINKWTNRVFVIYEKSDNF